MNFDLLGKLIGWLPGAGIGALLGGIGLGLWWDDVSSAEQCGFTVAGVSCVRWFGQSLSFTGAVVAAAAIGAVVGIVVNLVVVSLRAPGAAPPR